MPKYRAITVSVISQAGLKPHPEFPHPDSVQFELNGPFEQTEIHNPFETPGRFSKLPIISPSVYSPNGKSDKLLGRQPTVSVYIPSLAGTRFWIRYSIGSTRPSAPYFYFKLYMNGRQITSWGVNPDITPEGQVMRAPFAAPDRFGFRDDGAVVRCTGMEVRPFFFGPEDKDTMSSVAKEGGCIEVKVFRSRGKKRRMPHPQAFRNQEKFGVLMPEGSVHHQPQDMRFYDWVLIDPQDSPYARFRFHYRSWDQLQDLQLIPVDHPRTLGSPVPSESSMDDTGAITRNSLDSIHGEISMLSERRAPWSGAISAIKDASQLYDPDEDYTADYSDNEEEEESTLSSLKCQKHSPNHRTTRTLTSSLSNLSQHLPKPRRLKIRKSRPLPDPAELFPQQLTSSDLEQWVRPLPEPTIRARSISSLSLSGKSKAESTTPSLIPWNEREGDSSEHEVSQATLMRAPFNSRISMKTHAFPSEISLRTVVRIGLKADSSGFSLYDPDDQPSFVVRAERELQAEAYEDLVDDEDEEPSFTSFESDSQVYNFPTPPTARPFRKRTSGILPPSEANFAPPTSGRQTPVMSSSHPANPDLDDPFVGTSETGSLFKANESNAMSPSEQEWLMQSPPPVVVVLDAIDPSESPHFAESTVASRARERSETSGQDYLRSKSRQDSSPETSAKHASVKSTSFWSRRNFSGGRSWF